MVGKSLLNIDFRLRVNEKLGNVLAPGKEWGVFWLGFLPFCLVFFAFLLIRGALNFLLILGLNLLSSLSSRFFQLRVLDELRVVFFELVGFTLSSFAFLTLSFSS